MTRGENIQTGGIHRVDLVTMGPEGGIIPDGGLVYEEGRIIHAGSGEQARHLAGKRGIELVDGGGGVVFPGLVNTHMHLFQNLLKGLGADLELERWWPATIKPAAVQL